MPRRTKYREDTIKALEDQIRQHGQFKKACLACNLHEATFYEWKKIHPEFNKRVEQALEDYETNLREARSAEVKNLEDLSLKYFQECLEGKHYSEVVEEIEINTDPDGRVTKRVLRRKQSQPPAAMLAQIGQRILQSLGTTDTNLTVAIPVIEPEDQPAEEGDEDL